MNRETYHLVQAIFLVVMFLISLASSFRRLLLTQDLLFPSFYLACFNQLSQCGLFLFAIHGETVLSVRRDTNVGHSRQCQGTKNDETAVCASCIIFVYSYI